MEYVHPIVRRVVQNLRSVKVFGVVVHKSLEIYLMITKTYLEMKRFLPKSQITF